MRRLATLLFLAGVGCAPAPVVEPAPTMAPESATPAPAAPVIARIDISALRSDLTEFASDAFQGRLAGTPAAQRAAEFIAERLTALGLEAAGDSGSGFFQAVPLSRQVFAPTTKFLVTSRGRATDLKLGEDIVPLLRLGEGVPLPKLSGDGDIVFAGYALQSQQLGRNDLAQLDLAGKVVVFLGGAPPNADSATRARLEAPEQLGQRMGTILMQGPAAVVIIAGGKLESDFDALASEVTHGSLTLDATEQEPERVLPMIMFARPRTGSPLLPSRWPADDKPQALGRHLTARITLGRAQVIGHNVVAILRGSDPSFAESYVALGAHLDHIGVQAPVAGDSIANGADDDGSGSMGLVAIARALASSPSRPRRSLLFVWHTGEEAGMLGSEWFVTHPTVRLDSIVAQLNADMIGRNAPDSLMLVGPRVAPNGQSRVLGTVVDSVNASLSRPFVINREWDSPNHPEQIYLRSDHYSYAKRGIPIVFYTTGLHADYHKVSDEVSRIDFDKLSRVSELIMRSALAVANRPTRPR